MEHLVHTLSRSSGWKISQTYEEDTRFVAYLSTPNTGMPSVDIIICLCNVRESRLWAVGNWVAARQFIPGLQSIVVLCWDSGCLRRASQSLGERITRWPNGIDPTYAYCQRGLVCIGGLGAEIWTADRLINQDVIVDQRTGGASFLLSVKRH